LTKPINVDLEDKEVLSLKYVAYGAGNQSPADVSIFILNQGEFVPGSIRLGDCIIIIHIFKRYDTRTAGSGNV
jgi:hypothetical protein